MAYNEHHYSNLEMEFDNHFKQRGGLLPYQHVSYGDMLKTTLDAFQYRFDNYKNGIPKLPSINCNFIANTTVNAVASKGSSGNGYFIGIHIGTFHVLNDLFLRMMSSPHVMPAIGNPSKEKVTCKLFNPQITDLDQLLLSKHSDPESFMPVDYQRAYFAANFAKTALNFLFDHECGHIVSGHVSFIAHHHHMSAVEERRTKDDRMNGLDSQTLEMDADGFAAHHGILHMYQFMQIADRLPREKAAFFSGWENALSNWIFAVYSLFRLFGHKEYDIHCLEKYSHPPPAIRQRIMMLNIHGLLRDRLKVKISRDILEIMFDAIDHVESAFQALSETVLKKDLLGLAYSTEGNKLIGSLLGHWPAMRTKLEGYHHGYLAGS